VCWWNVNVLFAPDLRNLCACVCSSESSPCSQVLLSEQKRESEKEREGESESDESESERGRVRERVVLRSSQGHSTRKNGGGEGSQKIKKISGKKFLVELRGKKEPTLHKKGTSNEKI